MARPRALLRPPLPGDPSMMGGDPSAPDASAGPMPPMFGMGGPPAPAGPPLGGGPMPAGPGGGFPSANPALVAQLLGPLMQAQQQDQEQLQQEQMQSVLAVLASMKRSDAASASAATAPAPPPPDAQNTPPQGGSMGGGY